MTEPRRRAFSPAPTHISPGRQILALAKDPVLVKMQPPKSSGPFGISKAPSHFKMGVRYCYPICCVLHFCWDNALGRAASMTRWKQIHHSRGASDRVPCGLLHSGGSPLSFSKRLWRILRFECEFLQPTNLGKQRREFVAQGGPQYRGSTIEVRQRAVDGGFVEELWWGGEAAALRSNHDDIRAHE